MVAEVLAVSLVMASIRHPVLQSWAHGLMWAVVIFATVSAVDYFRKFWRGIDDRIKNRRRRELLLLERRRRREARTARSQSGSGVGGVRGTIS
jgi:hypothetical protein